MRSMYPDCVVPLYHHFLILKRLRKIILYAFALLLFTIVAISGVFYLYRNRILELVVAQANKQLKTPIRVDQLNVTWWREFPHLSVECVGVYVEDSHPETAALFVAKRVSFAFNAWALWRGKYVIERIAVQQSQTFIRINPAGVGNYDITTKTGDTAALSLQLNRISLTDAWVSYTDLRARQEHRFASEELSASLTSREHLYDIETRGLLRVEQIGVGNGRYLTDKDFGVQAHVLYDDKRKEVRIDSSILQHQNSRYQVAGTYTLTDTARVNLSLQGRDADVQTLLTFLPANEKQALAKYQSEGNVYFSAELKGRLSGAESPAMRVHFGWDRASLFHPDYDIRMEDAHLEGTLNMPELSDMTSATLDLQNISGKVNGEELSARVRIENFQQAWLTMDFTGTLNVGFIHSIYQPEAFTAQSGTVSGSLHYEGPLSRGQTVVPVRKLDGTLLFQKVHLTVHDPALELVDLTGQVSFTQADVTLSNFFGRTGNTDFYVNGLFRNVVNHVLSATEPVRVDAELQSQNMYIDELVERFQSRTDTQAGEPFRLSPAWTLNFNCQIDRLQYKKFKARFLAGDLQIRHQLAATRNVQMKTMGGDLTFNAIVDTQTRGLVDVVGGFQLGKIFLDSIFFVFDDFDQNFIRATHLKGRVDADVALEMTLTDQLKLRPETLIADVTATLRGGELNNFDPFQKLNRYLDDEGLSKLRFADLRNEIHIENQTIYMPQMEIRSNVTTIQLSGTHTFAQQFDYRLVAPLRNRKKIDPDEAFGAIEESKGKSRIFLKITGTPDNYDVSYDKSAVKQKIAGDLKKEVKELKDAFRLKGKQKKKELELSDEEFDWR